jgi:hypothetical protein
VSFSIALQKVTNWYKFNKSYCSFVPPKNCEDSSHQKMHYHDIGDLVGHFVTFPGRYLKVGVSGVGAGLLVASRSFLHGHA